MGRFSLFDQPPPFFLGLICVQGCVPNKKIVADQNLTVCPYYFCSLSPSHRSHSKKFLGFNVSQYRLYRSVCPAILLPGQRNTLVKIISHPLKCALLDEGFLFTSSGEGSVPVFFIILIFGRRLEAPQWHTGKPGGQVHIPE